jgi:hypothetical protein
MKNYQITIRSFKDNNVVRTEYFATKLQKEVLMDILSSLTKYSISIEEMKNYSKLALSMEGLLDFIVNLKLKTKVARNIMEVTKGNISDFIKKPNFDLNVWHGDNGETRTYINNMSFSQIDRVFPEIFELDGKSYKPYFKGELELIQLENKVWRLCFTTIKHKVIYEEVVLES